MAKVPLSIVIAGTVVILGFLATLVFLVFQGQQLDEVGRSLLNYGVPSAVALLGAWQATKAVHGVQAAKETLETVKRQTNGPIANLVQQVTTLTNSVDSSNATQTELNARENKE